MLRSKKAARKAAVADIVRRVRNGEYNGYTGGCGTADIIRAGSWDGLTITHQEADDALHRR
jgi:hypothetical protein